MSTGSGVMVVPILALQEAITVGLATLGSDQHAIDELLERDDDLQYNSAERWRASLRTAFREMVDPSNDQHCDVLVGLPTPFGVARLPAIALLVQGGGENTSEAVMGNVLRVSTELHGPNTEAWQTTEIGAGQTTTVEVSAWSPAVERSHMLLAAVKWSLYEMGDLLKRRGIHEVTYRELGDEQSPALEPRVAVVPMLSVTLSWTFRTTTRSKIPNRVTILPGTYS